MSLAAKPTWTSRARVEEFAQMRNAAENLRVLAEWSVTQPLYTSRLHNKFCLKAACLFSRGLCLILFPLKKLSVCFISFI